MPHMESLVLDRIKSKEDFDAAVKRLQEVTFSSGDYTYCWIKWHKLTFWRRNRHQEVVDPAKITLDFASFHNTGDGRPRDVIIDILMLLPIFNWAGREWYEKTLEGEFYVDAVFYSVDDGIDFRVPTQQEGQRIERQLGWRK